MQNFFVIFRFFCIFVKKSQTQTHFLTILHKRASDKRGCFDKWGCSHDNGDIPRKRCVLACCANIWQTLNCDKWGCSHDNGDIPRKRCVLACCANIWQTLTCDRWGRTFCKGTSPLSPLLSLCHHKKTASSI